MEIPNQWCHAFRTLSNPHERMTSQAKNTLDVTRVVQDALESDDTSNDDEKPKAGDDESTVNKARLARLEKGRRDYEDRNSMINKARVAYERQMEDFLNADIEDKMMAMKAIFDAKKREKGSDDDVSGDDLMALEALFDYKKRDKASDDNVSGDDDMNPKAGDGKKRQSDDDDIPDSDETHLEQKRQSTLERLAFSWLKQKLRK